MSFTETLEALGSWDLELKAETPDEIVAQVGYYGHLVVVDGQVDVDATGNGLLSAARYVGVCRAIAKPDTYTREGSGLLHWISDEDGKNHYIEAAITLTNATLAQVVTALLPPTVTVGTVFAQTVPATRYTGTHIFQSRRDALAIALAPFGAELRVNGNFTVDVGTPAQLYDATLPLTSKPSPMIVRNGAGSDIDLVAVGGKVDTEGAVWDYSTRALLLGQTIGTGDEPDTVFAVGSANAPSVPYKDPQGAAVKFTRPISESGETTGTVAARAQLHLNRFNRATTAIKVTADDYQISGGFGVGDATYVYDPDSGIFDLANQVIFRGEVIHPAVVRVSSLTTPIVEGMTVAWRTDAGVWLDLTRWVVWESAASREITVGDLSKTLSKPSDPIGDRVDAARGNPSTKVPKTPTGLALTTASALNAAGADASIVSATWDPVTQYVDNTTVALHHYEVQYRPQFRSPLWTASMPFGGTSGDLPVTARLIYDVQVRAVSTGGIPSAWSATQSITSAADSTAPAAPADPVLTQSLGQIRVRYPGTNNVGGAMPADANRVEVEVASAGSGGPFVTESSLNPFIEGIHRVGGTAGQTRWVRLRAFDHNGNPSAYSATVSAVIPQVQDGELAGMSVGKLIAGTILVDVIMAGRFATALTGARREMNAVGFQAFNASNVLTINLDGVNNLLTGIFKTALSGRRIEAGAGGASGQIDFIAPDTTLARIQSGTDDAGDESLRLSVPMAGVSEHWNTIHLSSAERILGMTEVISLVFGGAAGTGQFAVFGASNRGSAGVFPTNTMRFGITPASIFNYLLTAGDYMVLEHPTSGADIVRMWIDGGGANTFYHPDGAAFTVAERISGSNYSRLSVQPDWTIFNFPSINNRMLVKTPLFGADSSAEIQLVNHNGFGATIFGAATGGGGTNHRLEIKDAANSNYIPVWASAFTVSSSEAAKVGITELDDDPLEVLRAMRRVTFRRKGRGGADGQTTAEGHEEIGFIAENSHPSLVVRDGDGVIVGLDLQAEIATAIAAIQGLDGRLATVEQRGRAA